MKKTDLKEDKLNQELCHCINWHPSIKANMGKKARCSYCGNLRHIN